MEEKKNTRKIEVDRELCISSADCVVIAGETFELDDEGIARVKDPKGDSDEDILEAARACPVKAIKIFDENGEQIWPKD